MGNNPPAGPTRSVNYEFSTDRQQITRGDGIQIKRPFFFYNPVNSVSPSYNNEYGVANWNYPSPYTGVLVSSQFLPVWKSNNNNESGIFYRSNDVNMQSRPTVDLNGDRTRGKKVSQQLRFNSGTWGPWIDLVLVRGDSDQERKWWRADVGYIGDVQYAEQIQGWNFYIEYYV